MSEKHRTTPTVYLTQCTSPYLHMYNNHLPIILPRLAQNQTRNLKVWIRKEKQWCKFSRRYAVKLNCYLYSRRWHIYPAVNLGLPYHNLLAAEKISLLRVDMCPQQPTWPQYNTSKVSLKSSHPTKHTLPSSRSYFYWVIINSNWINNYKFHQAISNYLITRWPLQINS